MGRRKADHQEEGPVAVLADIGHGLFGLDCKQPLGPPRGRHDTRHAGHPLLEGTVGNLRKAVVLDKGIGREVGHVVAVVIVEAVVRGAVLQRLRVVDIRPVRGPVHRRPVRRGEADSQMPLPDQCGRVPRLAQHRGEGPLTGQQRIGPRPDHPLLERAPPGAAARQEAVARRRGDRRRAVRIGEAHPLGGQPVEMGRADASLRIVDRQVAVA